jgi:NADH pyrophosphatase NudC (nudix superfamily)
VSVRERLLLLTQSRYTLGVSAVAFDAKGDVLLLRNRFRYSSSWQLPGGFVSRGETLENAVRREILEETGISVKLVRQLHSRIARPQHLDVCFLCTVEGSELRLDRREILDGRFFDIHDLPPDVPEDQRALIAQAESSS